MLDTLVVQIHLPCLQLQAGVFHANICRSYMIGFALLLSFIWKSATMSRQFAGARWSRLVCQYLMGTPLTADEINMQLVIVSGTGLASKKLSCPMQQQQAQAHAVHRAVAWGCAASSMLFSTQQVPWCRYIPSLHLIYPHSAHALVLYVHCICIWACHCLSQVGVINCR